ncbi:MAG: FAD:protein FMN transferase [Actinobacteria bacterium]|nr:FAD:protein FMN transferase [Actinomycetota bacterium]MCG2802509.1 FAD:protein FMN transferase [Cellulomonas sp.]
MGLPVSVDVRDVDDGRIGPALDAAFAVLHAADARFSRYLPGSEVSRLRRGELTEAHASDELREVLEIAVRANRDSGGVFDVHTPDGLLDTDGVVKGWAAQRAADVLVRAGLSSFCLNAGGDVVTRGEPEPGRAWDVAVRDPRDPQAVLAVLALRDGAVATSGTYERGQHVWDGRTGSTDLALVAATVVAADLTVADVLATTVLAMGTDGVDWAVRHGAATVIVVTTDGRVLAGTPEPVSPAP